jgi:threonylcarbamoyladenosine tRNA methylthiotransferase MtaB
MKRFWIKTLGCKVNQYESQAIRERWQELGLQAANSVEKADLRLINTCTVTSRADRKSRNAISLAARNKHGARLIVTGCLTKFDYQELVKKIGGIDYIIPKAFFADGIKKFNLHTRAFVKVQDGCNNTCSFCKVSLVRGASRSRETPDVFKEIKQLVATGIKEIVLTGICLGSYGTDLSPKTDLVSLIKRLEDILGLERIRLSSIEPQLVNKDLIRLIRQSHKLCSHLHIPLQSGDNRILRRMNRQYTRETYLSLVEELKKDVPDIGITTDVIVGFPGEQPLHFENTLDILKRVIPLRVHSFIYSPRKLTTSAELEQTISQQALMERRQRLKLISEQLGFSFRNQFINKELRVLVEELKNGKAWGYADNYIKVSFSASRNSLNCLVLAKIKEVDMRQTRGVISG